MHRGDRKARPAKAASSPPSRDFCQFAKEVLGIDISSISPKEAAAQAEREELEWLAGISTAHEDQLRRLQRAEAEAAREQELREWVASIATPDWSKRDDGPISPELLDFVDAITDRRAVQFREANFNPAQPRDNSGKWSSAGGAGDGTPKADAADADGMFAPLTNAQHAPQLGKPASYAERHGGIKRDRVIHSMWDYYDADVAAGIIKPNMRQRIGVGVAKMLLPRSDPATVIEYGDGTKDIILSAGPTSGALADQAGAIQATGAATKVAAKAADGGFFGRAGKGALTGAIEQLSSVERKFAEELVAQGKNVHAVPRGPNRTPDFMVDGVLTELKTPTSAGPTTIKNAIQRAVKQGMSIVVDVRKLPVTPDDAAAQILRAEGNIGGLKGRVTVLTSGGVVTF